jgi:phage gp45-like
MSLRDEGAYRKPTSKGANTVRQMIRRLAIKVTTRALWQLVGHDDESEDAVEVFSGIGFYSRPPESGAPEAILVKVGGASSHGVLIATRDEKTRAAFAAIAALAANEVAIYNSSARVHIQADGTVVVDDGSGAVSLAKADHKHKLPVLVEGMPNTYGSLGPTDTGASDSNTTILKGK